MYSVSFGRPRSTWMNSEAQIDTRYSASGNTNAKFRNRMPKFWAWQFCAVCGR